MASGGVILPGGTPPPSQQALADASAGATEPPLTFCMVITKTEGMSMGIEITHSSVPAWSRNGVFIAGVSEEGMVAAWNAESEEPWRVHPGDFIFQINGIHGDIISMVQEIKIKQQLTIHVLRRVPEQPPEEDGMMPGPGGVGGEAPQAPPSPPTPQPQQAQAPQALPQAPPSPPPSQPQQAQANSPVKVEETGKEDGRPVATPTVDASRELPIKLTGMAEVLLPQIITLGDEDLAGLVCVAMECRPWLCESVLGVSMQRATAPAQANGLAGPLGAGGTPKA